MSRIIGWTYEADTHCPTCATRRFGATLQDATTTDREGNPLHPMFSTDEYLEAVQCGDCWDTIIESEVETAAPETDPDDEWRREMAMEEGMLHGIDAYNDVMGY